MSTIKVFTIDTKGTCLLCRKVVCDTEETSLLTSSSALKMLLRYLNIDVMKVDYLPSSFRPTLRQMSGSGKISIYLCSECCSVTTEFLELFQQMERIRIELDECAEILAEFIENGNKDPERILEYRRRMRRISSSEMKVTEGIVEMVRRETVRKCALRSNSSLPKVSLAEQLPKSEKNKTILSSPPPSASDCTTSKSTNYHEATPERDEIENDNEGGDLEIVTLEKTKTSLSSANPCIKAQLESVSSVYLSNKPTPPPIKTRIRAPPPGRQPEPRHQCNLCPKTFLRSAGLRFHVLVNHTLKTLSEKLPPNTSEEELTAAVDSIVSMWTSFPQDPTNNIGCALCPKQVSEKLFLRAHTLREHLDQVILKINEGKQKSQSSLGLAAASSRLVPTPVPPVAIPFTMKVEQDGGAVQQVRINFNPNIVINPSQPPRPSVVKKKTSATAPASHRDKMLLNKASSSTENTKLMICNLCGDRFSSHEELRFHQLQRHRTRDESSGVTKPSFKCIHCDNNFTQQSSLRTHLLGMHTMKMFALRVPPNTSENDMETAIRYVLRRERKVIKQGRRLFGCPHCSVVGQSVYELRTHMLRRHYGDIYKAIAKQKGLDETLEFYQPQPQRKLRKIAPKPEISLPKPTTFQFQSHVRSFQKRRPRFKGVSEHARCKYCGKFFTQKCNLTLHFASVHPIEWVGERLGYQVDADMFHSCTDEIVGRARAVDNEQTPVGCPCCSREFRKKCELKSHIVQVHLDEVKKNLDLEEGGGMVSNMDLELAMVVKGLLRVTCRAVL